MSSFNYPSVTSTITYSTPLLLLSYISTACLNKGWIFFKNLPPLMEVSTISVLYIWQNPNFLFPFANKSDSVHFSKTYHHKNLEPQSKMCWSHHKACKTAILKMLMVENCKSNEVASHYQCYETWPMVYTKTCTLSNTILHTLTPHMQSISISNVRYSKAADIKAKYFL